MKTNNQVKKKPIPPLYLRNIKELQAEAIGTFLIVLSTSLALIYQDVARFSMLGIALTHMTAIMVSMLFMYKISGAHFNPAISIAMIIIGRLDWLKGVYYILAQMVGAFIASIFIYIQLSDALMSKLKGLSIMGIPHTLNMDSSLSEFFGEIVGTLFMVYIYTAIIGFKNKSKNIEIGIMAFSFSVFTVSLTIGEISGACLNPFRSIAPSLIAGVVTKNQFFHIFGPIIGGAIGGLVYSNLYIDEDDEEFEEAVENPMKSYIKS